MVKCDQKLISGYHWVIWVIDSLFWLILNNALHMNSKEFCFYCIPIVKSDKNKRPTLLFCFHFNEDLLRNWLNTFSDEKNIEKPVIKY